jgi:hypothetical protein
MSGVTLTHTETDVEPECTVVFGGGRLRDDDLLDDCRIELTFQSAYYARAGWHDDDVGIEAIGYTITGVEPFHGAPHEYVAWAADRWRKLGCCPDPGVYVATRSDWLSEIQPRWRRIPLRHYVIDGRDGYAEVLAERFTWREWSWRGGSRDDIANMAPIATGDGID